MSQKRLELKVGLFVVIGLAVLVGLLLLFSKGFSLQPGYTLHLKARSAGTLKTRVGVMMSGVPVGTITEIRLAPDGRNVTIFLKIERQYQIHRDARFVIEQSGFLGDQYVSVLPAADNDTAPFLQEGDEVSAEAPFDLQEVARAAAGFIKRIDETAKRVNDTIADVRREALNETTLTNLAAAVTSLNKFSEEALRTVGNLDQLVQTNTAPISSAVSNLNAATITFNTLLADVQAGKGLAGAVLTDPALAANLRQTAGNLSNISSNLNRGGLWRFMWDKHPSGTNAPAAPGKK